MVRKKIKENPGSKEFYKILLWQTKNAKKSLQKKYKILLISKIIEDIVKNIENDGQKATAKNNINIKNKAENNIIRNKRVLVTGASGFLGTNILNELKTQNLEIIAQVRRGRNADKIFDKRIIKIFEDFSFKPVNYSNLLDNVKNIVHCAHCFREKTWEKYKETNVEGTLDLFKEAKKENVRVLYLLAALQFMAYNMREK